MIRRLIKDFNSNILFSACFDYDIGAYYIYIYSSCTNMWKFIINVPHVHNIASQTMGKVYIETYQSLWLTNIVILMEFSYLVDKVRIIK